MNTSSAPQVPATPFVMQADLAAVSAAAARASAASVELTFEGVNADVAATLAKLASRKITLDVVGDFVGRELRAKPLTDKSDKLQIEARQLAVTKVGRWDEKKLCQMAERSRSAAAQKLIEKSRAAARERREALELRRDAVEQRRSELLLNDLWPDALDCVEGPYWRRQVVADMTSHQVPACAPPGYLDSMDRVLDDAEKAIANYVFDYAVEVGKEKAVRHGKTDREKARRPGRRN